MSSTARLLVGLGAGLVAGALLPTLGASVPARLVPVVEPFGILWVNAIRMTVLPMVVALLVAGIGGTRDGARLGRVGLRALLLAAAMLAGAAALVALAAPPLFERMPLSAATIDALRAQARAELGAHAGPLSFGEWLTGLLPANPVKAAADGALLPLVVFSILFGLAATRLPADRRDALVGFARAVADAMLVLVRWVLALAPLGVFALALSLAARTGLAAAGALAFYIAVTAGACLALSLGCLVLAVALGRQPLRALLSAGAPAAAVAFSSRSSLASLPALVAGAERLRFPPTVIAVVLPLAVATFRLGAMVAMLVGPLFLARLYGVTVAPAQVVGIALSSVLLSFSIPGVPAGVLLVMAPVLTSLGIPAAGLGILLAIDTVPDMFRTMTNVTADMAAATVLARDAGDERRAAGPAQ